MGAAHAFWAPISGLIEAMESPLNTAPVISITGWIALISAVAGIVVCIRRGSYTPLIVLAGVVPAYLAIVFLFWPGGRARLPLFPVTGAIAALLSFALIGLGFVRARGNRVGATLMLPCNVLFLGALLLLTGFVEHRP